MQLKTIKTMSKLVDILTTAFSWATQGATINEIAPLLEQLDEVKVKVWRENETVKLPTYAKPGDACMDVYVHSIENKEDGRVIYHTGLHFKLPEDYEMIIRPRSSITKTFAVMQNSPGTLDEGYTGELLIVHRNLNDPKIAIPQYAIGDRCGQILVRRREYIFWDEVHSQEELGETERGSGGFGSSGN